MGVIGDLLRLEPSTVPSEREAWLNMRLFVYRDDDAPKILEQPARNFIPNLSHA